jgi:hypothetical protein
MFRQFNPIFIHTSTSRDDLELNLEARNQEKDSLTKSDSDITIYNRYETLMNSYSNSLQVPKGSQMIELSTRLNDYEQDVRNLGSMIIKNNHRLVIMSGNVLTGKTFTARKIEDMLSGNIIKK